jgi:hypothetical protein
MGLSAVQECADKERHWRTLTQNEISASFSACRCFASLHSDALKVPFASAKLRRKGTKSAACFSHICAPAAQNACSGVAAVVAARLHSWESAGDQRLCIWRTSAADARTGDPVTWWLLASAHTNEVIRVIASTTRFDFDLRPESTDALVKLGVSEDITAAA